MFKYQLFIKYELSSDNAHWRAKLTCNGQNQSFASYSCADDAWVVFTRYFNAAVG